MDKDELIELLRLLINKEQELYRIYTDLAEKSIQRELKEIIGHLAYEEYIHLSTLLEKYKSLIDEK